MASPTAKNTSQRGRDGLWNYFMIVIVSATMGAGLTWLIMSQRSTPQARPVPSPPTTTSAPIINTTPDVSGMSAPESAVTLGNFAYDHQQWPEAIRQYQAAIASGIETADVHTDLGNAFRFSGQPEKALEQYLIAQRLNPQHENSLFNQISLFTEVLNQPARAVPICEEFIRRFPTSEKLPAVQQQLALAKGTKP